MCSLGRSIVSTLKNLTHPLSAILPSRDVAQDERRNIPAWERWPYWLAVSSPESRLRAAFSPHRPALGEFRARGRRNRSVSAQDPALGENCPFGQERDSAFPQVNGLALLTVSPKPGCCAGVFLPSREVVAGTPAFAAQARQALPSRDFAQGEWHINPPWERLWLSMMGVLPRRVGARWAQTLSRLRRGCFAGLKMFLRSHEEAHFACERCCVVECALPNETPLETLLAIRAEDAVGTSRVLRTSPGSSAA